MRLTHPALIANLVITLALSHVSAGSAATPAPAPDAAESAPCAVSLKRFDTGGVTFTTLHSTGYWIYVDPALCTACPSPAIVTAKDIRVAIGAGLCQTSYQITLVATDGNVAAPAPDPSHVLSATQTIVFAANCAVVCLKLIPLSPELPIDRPCFLHLALISPQICGDYEPWVGRGPDGDCHPYHSYFSSPDSGPRMEMCQTFGYDPILVVDATCDAAVPTQRHAWGALKIRYR